MAIRKDIFDDPKLSSRDPQLTQPDAEPAAQPKMLTATMSKGLRIRIVVGSVWVYLVYAIAEELDDLGLNQLWRTDLRDYEVVLLLAGLILLFAIDIWRWIQRGG